MWQVFETKTAEKQLDKLQKHLLQRYEKWKEIVELSGPEGLRLIKGFYDHGLTGKWAGYRSSSLNETYRVIYKINKDEIYIEVVEVNAHDYRKRG